MAPSYSSVQWHNQLTPTEISQWEVLITRIHEIRQYLKNHNKKISRLFAMRRAKVKFKEHESARFKKSTRT